MTPQAARSATFLQTRRQTDQRIKYMPITKRPDRIGHVYGNSVRRVYRLTNGRLNVDEVRLKVTNGDGLLETGKK